MFFYNILISFGLIFIFGGFWVFGKTLLGWQDERYLDKKIGAWSKKQEKITVQIIPPPVNERSMIEMESFFINLASIFSNKSKKDIYIEGKTHEHYTFEVHSRGGQINLYATFNKNHLPIFRGSLSAHYPTASVIETVDPFETWPKEWTGQVGPYTQMFGSDMVLFFSDLYPVKSWTYFQRDDNTPISDPFSTLLTGLENIGAEDYVVLQFVLRPRSDQDEVKRWKEELKALRKEFKTNANVDVDEKGGVQLLTKNEQEILHSIETKIAKDTYQFKIRMIGLTATGGPARLIGPIMAYLKQYATQNQFFKPDGDTKTSSSSDSKDWGPFWDKFYWKREQEYRKSLIYESLIKRSLGSGSKPKYIDVESLASLFHFPSTELIDQSLASRVSTESGDTGALPSGTPPRDLPI
jgi:hypothetical protein